MRGTIFIGGGVFAVSAVLFVFGGGAYGDAPRQQSATGCPPTRFFPPNSRQADRTPLALRGAIRMVVCRYSATDPKARAVVNEPRTIHVITRELNGLHQLPQHRMWVSCPKSDATIIDVILHYRGRRTRIVSIEADGCQWVKSGKQRRWAFFAPGPRLIRRLEALTDCRARPRTRFGCR